MSGAYQAVVVVLPMLYLILASLYAMEFGGPRAPRPRRSRQLIALALVLVHASYIMGLWVQVGHLPAADPWLLPSLLALGMMLIYLPVEWLTNTPQTGSIVVGSGCVLQLISSCLVAWPTPYSKPLEGAVFAIHVGTGILALSALLLSGFYGALYLILLRQIRQHHFGILFTHLPDLESLSRLNRSTATAGFLLLTVGLNLALAWAHADQAIKVDYLDPKILTVLCTWIFFGLIAASRWIKLLSGRRAALLAVSGLGLIFLTLVLASVRLGSLHLF